MTAKKSKTTKKAPLTYPLVVTRDDADREFKRQQNHHDSDSGDNDTARFLRTMEAIYAIKSDGWTVTDILRFSEKTAIDPRKVMELWSAYKSTMMKLNKIVEVATCLDEKMFAAVR